MILSLLLVENRPKIRNMTSGNDREDFQNNVSSGIRDKY